MASPRSKPARKKAVARKSTASVGKGAAIKLSALRTPPPPIAFDHAPVVAFSYRYSDENNHGFSAISPQAKSILGMKPVELLKESSGLRLHPDDVETFESSVLGAMAKGAPVDADRKSTRLNSSHGGISRMPSSA